MADPQLRVTFTGIYGDMRRRGKADLASLGVRYEGALVEGATSHIIVDPAALAALLADDAPSDKLRTAVRLGIPVVRQAWITESAAAGRCLPTAPFELAPSQLHTPGPQNSGTTGAGGDGSDMELGSPEVARAAPTASVEMGAGNLAALPSPEVTSRPLNARQPTPPLPSPSAADTDALPSPSAGVATADLPELSLGGIVGDDEAWEGGDGGSFMPPIPEDEEVSDDAAPPAPPALPPPSSRRAQRSSLLRIADRRDPPIPLSAVTPGPAAAVPPDARTLGSLRAWHKTARPGAFFDSVTVRTGLANRSQLEFAAGDRSHGAKIIYNVDSESERQIFAHVIIRAFYALEHSPDELWMAHHYLFTADDVEERPAWAAALEREPMDDDELLLSSNVYHSPVDLIVDDFGVDLARRVGRSGRGGLRPRGRGGAGVGGSSGVYTPVLTCRRGFDAARVRVVQLSEALGGW